MFDKLIQILDKKQKKQGILLFFLLMVTSVLEMLGISVIVPFIVAMLEPDKIMQNEYIKPFVQIFKITDYEKFMYVISAGIIIIYVIKNSFILIVNYYQSKYRNNLEKDLNIKMLSAYMKRPYSFFVNTNSAEILRGVNGDITNVASVVDSFSNIFAEGLTCLIIGIFLVMMSPFMAISLILILVFVALAIILGFKSITGRCGEQCREAFSEKFKNLNQAIDGIKEISVTQKRDFFMDKYALSTRKAAISNTKYLWISKTPSRLIETIFISCLLIVVMASYDGGQDSIRFATELGAIGIAAVRILPSVSTLTNALNGLVFLRPSLEEAYLNIVQNDYYWTNIVSKDTIQKDSFESVISINNISWSYGETSPFVLEHLCLEINKGDSVAFIGESGAGKSTLADCLLGLYKPACGEICVDGVNIFSMQKSWSKMIGYVPQMVFLLDDTIRNNIAFGIKDTEIDDTKIWEVLEQAQLKNVVISLEKGLDTVIGERGMKLSGGQRQRLAIARALYHNPDILILDEATSALDSDTENAVMEAIEALKGKKTLIIIAHRLTTIKSCNKVYEIKAGQAFQRDNNFH